MKGYPSRHRARRAFWRGVMSARCRSFLNPYRNARLHALWERGRRMGDANPAMPIPMGQRPKSQREPKPRHFDRGGGGPRGYAPTNKTPRGYRGR